MRYLFKIEVEPEDKRKENAKLDAGQIEEKYKPPRQDAYFILHIFCLVF